MTKIQMLSVLAVLVVGVLLLTPAAVRAQPTADLRPRLTEGQSDRFDFFQEGHLTLTMPDVPGAGAEQTVTQEMRIALTIDERTEEGAKGTITFERLAITLSGGGMDSAFDSDKPESADRDNPLAPMLRPMVGKSIGVTFDEAGNVTALTGLRDVMPGGGLGGALGDLLDEQGLKGGVTQITSTGQGAAVRRVGETWTSTDSIDLPEGGGKLEMITTHHLKSVRGEKATVTLESDLRTRDKKSGAKGGLDVRTSTLEGRYVWDTERGMMDSLEFDRVIEFDVDRSGVKASIKQDVRTKVTRVK